MREIELTKEESLQLKNYDVQAELYFQQNNITDDGFDQYHYHRENMPKGLYNKIYSFPKRKRKW